MKGETLAIIAGNGQFPIETAKRAKSMGYTVVAICHIAETDEIIKTIADHCEWIKIGQLAKILRYVKKYKATKAVFTGGISRVRLFKNALPDMTGLALIARIGTIRDDVFLRAVAGEVEKAGAIVVSSGEILTESVVKAGCLTKRALTKSEAKDALVGWDAAKTLGSLDIGQTAVVSDGVIAALECIEGTDRAILRAGELLHKRASVIVKTAKPQQDIRLDLPAVGLGTLETMLQAGAQVLVLEHERAMVLSPDEFVNRANALNMAICVVKNRSELESI